MGKHLLRRGTAIGALIHETQNSENKADFIHKLGIAQKKCDETAYSLELLRGTNYLTEKEFEDIHCDAIEVLKMLRSDIITSKRNNS